MNTPKATTPALRAIRSNVYLIKRVIPLQGSCTLPRYTKLAFQLRYPLSHFTTVSKSFLSFCVHVFTYCLLLLCLFLKYPTYLSLHPLASPKSEYFLSLHHMLTESPTSPPKTTHTHRLLRYPFIKVVPRTYLNPRCFKGVR